MRKFTIAVVVVTLMTLLPCSSFAWFFSKELPEDEQQKICEEFVDEVYAVDKEAQLFIDVAQKETENPSSREVLYTAISRARDASSVAWQAYRKMPQNIPEELKKTVREKLEKACENFELCYYSRRKMYDNMMDYLNTNSQKSLQNVREESNWAQQYMFIGVAQLLEAKGEYGSSDEE